MVSREVDAKILCVISSSAMVKMSVVYISR